MHWLAQRLDRLETLARDYEALRGRARSREVTADSAEQARKAFFHALGQTAQDIQRRPGVDACFVSHDGLVCEMAGDAPSFDALAAFAQSCVDLARNPVPRKLLGGMRQMVVVGETGKIALFHVGTMAVGIQCGLEVNLARVLSA